MTKRNNTKMINKFLQDNCPDFRQKIKDRLVKTYSEYFRKVVLKNTESIEHIQGISRQQLIDLVNSRTNRYKSNQDSQAAEARANNIINQVINRVDPRIAQYPRLMAFFGFSGEENYEFSRLSTPIALNRTLNILHSMQNIVRNSGLDVNDLDILCSEIRRLIVE